MHGLQLSELFSYLNTNSNLVNCLAAIYTDWLSLAGQTAFIFLHRVGKKDSFFPDPMEKEKKAARLILAW